jgi:hypothetical protein
MDIGEDFFGSLSLGGKRALPDVERFFAAAAQSMISSLSGGFSPTYNTSNQTDSFQFFAPVVMQGSTPTGSLGARLKGRRY